jgi:hypothetical protein
MSAVKPPFDVALPVITDEILEAYGGGLTFIEQNERDWTSEAVDFAAEIVRPAVQERIRELEAILAAIENRGAFRLATRVAKLEAALDVAKKAITEDMHYHALSKHAERLTDALRLAEPLLPPNTPWGVIDKVRKALAESGA